MEGRGKAVERPMKGSGRSNKGSGRSGKGSGRSKKWQWKVEEIRYRTPGGSGGDGGGGGPGGTGGGGGIPSFLNFGHEALVSSTTRKGTVIV